MYQEQPDVHYKHKVLVILETDSGYITWSTYPNYNQIHTDHLRIPLVKSREDDANSDGLLDTLHFQLDMPLITGERVLSVQLMLMLDYKLHQYSSLCMESMAYIHHSSPRPGTALTTTGDLQLRLRAPLASRGADTRYDSPVIDENTHFAEDVDLAHILQSYATRNVTTSFERQYPVWTSALGIDDSFVVKATVQYSEDSVLFRPGFWQVVKWGWVQYASLLVLFWFILGRVQTFIFQNQLVTTLVERPWGGRDNKWHVPGR